MRFSRPWPSHRCRGCHLRDRCDWRQTIYARTGTAVAFIISELPGERAEALFIAMAALVPTAGKQSTTRPGLMLREARYSGRKTCRLNGRAP